MSEHDAMRGAVRADLRAHGPVAPWTSEQLDRFRSEWERQKLGRPVFLTPLPRRVRARLAAEHAVNRAGIRLVERKRYRAARWLWRAFGMWRH